MVDGHVHHGVGGLVIWNFVGHAFARAGYSLQCHTRRDERPWMRLEGRSDPVINRRMMVYAKCQLITLLVNSLMMGGFVATSELLFESRPLRVKSALVYGRVRR